MSAPVASREAAASLQAQRGKPAWREAMRTLPVAEKLAVLERAIRETIALERSKSEWKKSVKSSSSLSPAAR